MPTTVLYNWPEDGRNMRKVHEITVLVKGWLAQDVVVDGQKPGGSFEGQIKGLGCHQCAWKPVKIIVSLHCISL